MQSNEAIEIIVPVLLFTKHIKNVSNYYINVIKEKKKKKNQCPQPYNNYSCFIDTDTQLKCFFHI